MVKKIALLLILLLSVTPISFAQDDDEDLAQRLIDKIIESSEAKSSDSADRTDITTNAKDRAAAKIIRRILKTRKVSVNFDDIEFDEAMDFLRDVTGLNIVVSKGAKSLIDDSAKKVKLRLKNIRLRSCLIHMLESIDKELCFGIQHQVLMIGTKEEFKSRSVILRLYRVGDILKRPPDFPGPRLGLPDNKNKP
jgi:hypothetical protein